MIKKAIPIPSPYCTKDCKEYVFDAEDIFAERESIAKELEVLFDELYKMDCGDCPHYFGTDGCVDPDCPMYKLSELAKELKESKL